VLCIKRQNDIEISMDSGIRDDELPFDITPLSGMKAPHEKRLKKKRVI